MRSRYQLAKRAYLREINTIRSTYVLLLVGLISLVFVLHFRQVNGTGEVMTEHFKRKDYLLSAEVNSMPNKVPQVLKLKKQFLLINQLKQPYLFLAQRFNTYSYVFALMFPLCSIIAGILGFIIVKKGWDNLTNFYMKSTFLVFFFFSSLFGVLPQVYKTKENIAKNIQKYHEYNALEVEIYNFINDNKGYIAGHKFAQLDSVISGINESIKNKQDLFFDIDIEKVPKDLKPVLNN